MKRIEALIPHDLIQDVEQSLTSLGVRGLTLTSVYSQSLSPGPLVSSRRTAGFGNPCCKLDVLVCDADLPKVYAALRQTAVAPSRVQIFVMNLESTIRIRTGECEEAALS